MGIWSFNYAKRAPTRVFIKGIPKMVNKDVQLLEYKSAQKMVNCMPRFREIEVHTFWKIRVHKNSHYCVQ